jgi:uncharacterized protein (TIGR02118 family)
VSVLFPRKAGAKFNSKYYGEKHLPMLREKFGQACKAIVIDRGIRGGTPDAPAPFLIVANLMFENLEAFQNSFRPNAQAIMEDFANFSNVQPIIQIMLIRLTPKPTWANIRHEQHLPNPRHSPAR